MVRPGSCSAGPAYEGSRPEGASKTPLTSANPQLQSLAGMPWPANPARVTWRHLTKASRRLPQRLLTHVESQGANCDQDRLIGIEGLDQAAAQRDAVSAT